MVQVKAHKDSSWTCIHPRSSCTWPSLPWTEWRQVSKGDNTDSWSGVTLSRQHLGTYLLIWGCLALAFLLLSLQSNKNLFFAFGNSLVSWSHGNPLTHEKKTTLTSTLSFCLWIQVFKKLLPDQLLLEKERRNSWNLTMRWLMKAHRSGLLRHDRAYWCKIRGSLFSPKSLLELRIQSPKEFDFRSSIFHTIYWKS